MSRVSDCHLEKPLCSVSSYHLFRINIACPRVQLPIQRIVHGTVRSIAAVGDVDRRGMVLATCKVRFDEHVSGFQIRIV